MSLPQSSVNVLSTKTIEKTGKSIEEVILENIRLLPDDKKQEVLDFVEYLKSKLEQLEQITEYKEIASDPQPIANRKHSKERTIAQAIVEVMNEVNRPMTSREISQLILEKNLYSFNTEDAQGMVYNALWRHSIKQGKRSSPNKHFTQEGKQWVLAHKSSLVSQPTELDHQEITEIDIEESLYGYFLLSQDWEDSKS